MASIITLTTDFGARDPYVAAVKGVILKVYSGVTIVDLTHEIPPQDIAEAALFLRSCVACFPAGTVHLVVVDPTVGSGRRAIAAAAGNQTFVCPDNGLLTLVLRDTRLQVAHEITNTAFLRGQASPTFHARDVFAPVAACLAQGMSIGEVGPPVDDLALLDWPAPRISADRIEGVVVHVDRFGNAITNIHRDDIAQLGDCEVRVGSLSLKPLHRTYDDVSSNQPLALIGSAKHLEIAVNRGCAATVFGLERHDAVEVVRAQ